MSKDKTKSILSQVIEYLEYGVAIFLAFIVFFGLIYFSSQFITFFGKGHYFLNTIQIHKLLDTVLVLFIAIELFRITLAYIEGKVVLNIVIEAALVAMARKIVLFEYNQSAMLESVALGILTLVLILAYWSLSKSSRPEE